MGNLTVFDFNSNQVRTVSIEGQPWFVAKDVCNALDILNTSQVVSKLDEDEKLLYLMYIAGQQRETVLVSESGMYSLVLKSRKPEAKTFKKWITAVVLPSIRQNESYQVATEPARQLPPVRDVVDYAKSLAVITTTAMPAALKQAFLDRLGDEMITTKIPGQITTAPRLVGVVQKAEELGYKLDHSQKVRIGKLVKDTGLPYTREERYCKGQMRPINCYKDSPELESAIHSVFAQLN
jgi:prophage antirepressor-like protein